MKTSRSNKGFTLVEIMIVVVIIGLLAAMAIPAFKKVRENSIGKTAINDARQLGGAAQQYFMENGASSVTVGTSTGGSVTGPLSVYVTKISANNTIGQSTFDTATNFTIINANLKAFASPGGGASKDGTWTFDSQGVLVP